MRNVIVAVLIGIILALGIWLSWRIRRQDNQTKISPTIEVLDTAALPSQQTVNVAGYNIQLEPNRNLLARLETELSKPVAVPTNTPVPLSPQTDPTPTPIPTTPEPVVTAVIIPTRVVVPTASSVNQCHNAGLVAHTVSQGETLYSIAQRYNTTVELMAECDIASGDMIPGNVIYVPVRSPGSTEIQNVTCNAGSRTHTVQNGENVFRIGIRYGVDKDAIRSANNLNANYLIYPGDVLCIP